MKSFLLSTIKIDFKNKGSYDSDANMKAGDAITIPWIYFSI